MSEKILEEEPLTQAIFMYEIDKYLKALSMQKPTDDFTLNLDHQRNLIVLLAEGMNYRYISLETGRKISKYMRSNNYGLKTTHELLLEVARDAIYRKKSMPRENELGPNMKAPAPEKSKTCELKISSLREKYWEKYGKGRHIKLYDEETSEEIFEGTGYWDEGSPCVKGIGKYRGLSAKLQPGYQMKKRDNGEREKWRSSILIE